MKILSFFLCVQFFIVSVQAEPFSYLEKSKIKTELNTDFFIHYNPKQFQKVFKERNKFPKNHPFYIDELGSDDIIIGIFDISGNGDKYYVTFGTGPSFDPNFCFNKVIDVINASSKGKKIYDCKETIYALSLVISGNGNVYSYGHANSLHDVRHKYKFQNDKLVLTKQPFQFSGKRTKSLADQEAYTDESLSTISFKISKGYPVTVVGVIPESNNKVSNQQLYIVATDFGLVGFVPVIISQYKANQFEGFFFNGD